jgi:hypothetical protein
LPDPAIDFSALGPSQPPPRGEHGFRPALIAGLRHVDHVLGEHGAVGDGKTYTERHLARWRAQRLAALMVRAGLREAWELRQRVWRVDDGWQWSVQLEHGEPNHGRN